jgi:low affinity Fe/Cu permease
VKRPSSAIDVAHNDMINIEKLSDEELEVLTKRFQDIRAEYESRTHRKNRTSTSAKETKIVSN